MHRGEVFSPRRPRGGAKITVGRWKGVGLSLFSLFVGVVVGGYLFDQSQPRSFLSINHCDHCLNAKDLAGLLTSVGVHKMPGLIPSVVFESEKTIVIKNPRPESRFDYILIPKKDIKNIGDLTEEDAPYLIDVYLVARTIVEKEKVSNYRLFTNGPGFQDATYLHFHLLMAKQ